MTTVEIIAVAFGLACVWLTIRQNIWCWPTGLVMVLLYIAIFYQARLYSDMLLQVVYVFLQIYGWHYWLHGGRDVHAGAAVISRLSAPAVTAWMFVAVVSIAALGFTMDRYTDADLAYWDATTTVLSLIAQWLLGRKVLESWALWIAVDVLSIGIYSVKELYLSAGLYAVFLVLATLGFIAWSRAMPKPAVA